MKWYSIKKYNPPAGFELILRIEKNKYERYIIAILETYAYDIKVICNWKLANDMISGLDLDAYQITHFAIPDPVELED